MVALEEDWVWPGCTYEKMAFALLVVACPS